MVKMKMMMTTTAMISMIQRKRWRYLSLLKKKAGSITSCDYLILSFWWER